MIYMCLSEFVDKEQLSEPQRLNVSFLDRNDFHIHTLKRRQRCPNSISIVEHFAKKQQPLGSANCSKLRNVNCQFPMFPSLNTAFPKQAWLQGSWRFWQKTRFGRLGQNLCVGTGLRRLPLPPGASIAGSWLPKSICSAKHMFLINTVIFSKRIINFLRIRHIFERTNQIFESHN